MDEPVFSSEDRKNYSLTTAVLTGTKLGKKSSTNGKRKNLVKGESHTRVQADLRHGRGDSRDRKRGKEW